MIIFVDENIPRMTVAALEALGHDVHDIRGTEDKGMSDEDLWGMVQKVGGLLITTDKGFAQRRQESHSGILIIRLRQPNRLKIHQRAMQAISQYRENEWPGLLVVMRDVVQSVWRRSSE